ncbi:NrfD/PsrC family molybdoenzyme membrane anchor subunit [Thermodesulfobacteriota bacterium]
MITSNASGFTFQTEWVEKRGLFLVLAFFLGGLGSGLYLISLYLDFYIGMMAGFLIVLVGKSAAHLIYLGRPLRFWRGFLKPQTSWISRGMFAITIFVVAVALQLAPSLTQFSWLPWTGDNLVIQTFAVIGAIFVMSYTGLTLAAVKAIRSWNTGIIPVLFIVYSIMGGAGLALGMLSQIKSNINMQLIETITIYLLIVGAVLLGIYLWTTYDSTREGKQSVFELLKGKSSPYFFVGVVAFGLLIPLCVVSFSLISKLPPIILAITSACEIIGGFSMRYSILKASAYARLA